MTRKRAWVVGGATGFGAEISKYYWQKGWDICLSSSNQDKIQRFCDKFNKNRPNQSIDWCTLDLAHHESHERIAKKVLSDGPIDLLVITSAISNSDSPPSPMLKGPSELYKKFMDINAVGPWILTREMLSLIKGSQRELSTIYFTSKAAWASTPNFGFYNTSKSLLQHLILNLFSEIQSVYPYFKFKAAIVEPNEARTEMNRESHVSPIGVLPAIHLIEKSDVCDRVLIINKELEEMKFTYSLANSTKQLL